MPQSLPRAAVSSERPRRKSRGPRRRLGIFSARAQHPTEKSPLTFFHADRGGDAQFAACSQFAAEKTRAFFPLNGVSLIVKKSSCTPDGGKFLPSVRTLAFAGAPQRNPGPEHNVARESQFACGVRTAEPAAASRSLPPWETIPALVACLPRVPIVKPHSRSPLITNSSLLTPSSPLLP
jgi:hypothetical protein